MAVELAKLPLCLEITSEVEPMVAVTVSLLACERGASEFVALRIDGMEAGVARP